MEWFNQSSKQQLQRQQQQHSNVLFVPVQKLTRSESSKLQRSDSKAITSCLISARITTIARCKLVQTGKLNSYEKGMTGTPLNNTTVAPIDSCTVNPSGENLGIAIVLLILCVGILLGNLAVCLTVLLHRNLHTVTIVMVVSLATADLFVSMFSLPWRIHYTLHDETWCLGREICGFWIWTDSFACCASICNLAAIGIERFIAIKCPLRYPELVTKTTGAFMISVVWIYALIVSSLGNLNWTRPGEPAFTSLQQKNGCYKNDRDYYTFVAALAFLLPQTIVVLTYAYLTHVALSHRRALINSVVPTAQGGRSLSVAFRRDHRASRFFKELKATKMMVVVVGAFTVSWLPFFVLVLLSLWSDAYMAKYTDPAYHKEGRILRIVFVTILPNVNSFCNPLIYIAFTRELRHAILKVIRKLLPCTKGMLPRESTVSQAGTLNTAASGVSGKSPSLSRASFR